MNDSAPIIEWFPDPMSDNTAFAVYLFLEQFTLQFESAYYGQIRRYIDSQRLDSEDHSPCHNMQLNLPWKEEEVNF